MGVSLRGTKEDLNWVQNTDIPLIDCKLSVGSSGEIEDVFEPEPESESPKVHRGYHGALGRLLVGILKQLEEGLKQLNEEVRVFLTPLTIHETS